MVAMLYAMIAVQPDLRTAVPFLVLTSAAIAILMALTQYLGDRCDIRISPAMILGVAAIIRLMFVFRPPELSDDIWRYLWDGMRMVSGNNPYALPPAAVFPQSPAAAKILASVNHPELVTIYPPGAQAVFLWAAVLSPGVLGLKCLLMLMDMGSTAMIIRLLSRYDLPAGRSILYAWNPLAVLEISGSGHIDGAGIFFLLLSLSTAAAGFAVPPAGGKPENRLTVFFSGAFYAWSCLIKLFPVLFFPLILKYAGRRNIPLFLAGLSAGGLLLCLPFLPRMPNMFTTLFHYARHWEFSGLSFLCLRLLNIPGDWSRGILAAVFLTVASALWLRAPAGLSGINTHVTSGFFNSLYRITLVFLFLSPTLHPWYALYLASVLPFVAGLAGFILSWSVFLAYAVLIPYALTGQWEENHLATILIWAGPFAAFSLMAIIARIRPAVSVPCRRPPPP
jgi:hypothetical protein